MHRHDLPRERLARLLDAQSGCVSTRQALGVGVAEKTLARWVREGWLVTPTRGLYLRPDAEWAGWVWGGVLLGGEGAVVGGTAALALRGLVSQPEVIDIWAPERRHLRRGPWRFRQSAREALGSPPALRVEQAIIDVTGELSEGDLIMLVGRAIADRRTTRERVWREASRRLRVSRRALLRELLVGGDQGVESPLEWRYRRDVAKAHGLPGSLSQVNLPRGRADSLIDECGVVVELDGEAYHGLERRVVDRERDTINAAHGLVTIRAGWAEVVGDPCGLARRIAAVLTARGWLGEPRACGRCR